MKNLQKFYKKLKSKINMRKICLINQNPNSNLSLNIYSKLARAGKRVLIVDLRLSKDQETNKNSVGLDIYHCINENQKPEKFIISLEPNLDIIKGSSKLNFQEFNTFYEFFKLDYFEKSFKKLNYDYIIYEVSPQLNLITTNALFDSNEIQAIIDFDKAGLDFIHKLARFTFHFNKIYSKQILISKIIPTYKNKLNKNNYVHLVSEFTSKLVSFPIFEDIKSKNFKDELLNVSTSILDDEKLFSDEIQTKEKQKLIKEYLNIISENSFPEKPLTKF